MQKRREEMQRQSLNPNSGGTWSIQPRCNDVGASSSSSASPHPMFFMNSGVPVPIHMEQAMNPTPLLFSALESRRATLNLDKAIEYELKHGRKLDPEMDRKKLRRTVSNRLSAQRSRMRKAHYIDDMEKKVAQLEETIIVVSERVRRVKEHLQAMREQNEELEKVLGIRMNEAIHSQLMIERNQAELRRLKAEENEMVGSWSCNGPGLYHQDVKLLQIRHGDAAAFNPFLN